MKLRSEETAWKFLLLISKKLSYDLVSYTKSNDEIKNERQRNERTIKEYKLAHFQPLLIIKNNNNKMNFNGCHPIVWHNRSIYVFIYVYTQQYSTIVSNYNFYLVRGDMFRLLMYLNARSNSAQAYICFLTTCIYIYIFY